MQNVAEHIVSGFDEELNMLSTTIAQLGGLVETMVADSVKSLKTRDDDLANSVIERDRQANLLQEKIDDDAMRIFALRHPMATDLRRVIGAIKVATDLERVGDLAEGIARRAKHVWLGDEDIDEMYNSLFRELLTYMMEDPRTISSSAGLLFAAKNLERIGDHATNIAETIHFIVEGTPLTFEKARQVDS